MAYFDFAALCVLVMITAKWPKLILKNNFEPILMPSLTVILYCL